MRADHCAKPCDEEHRSRIGYQIRTLNNLMVRQIEGRVQAMGLTTMQAWIIGYLYHRSGQDVFQRDLENEFSIGRSTATSILQLMEKRGFVTRQPVERDARLKKLCLTEQACRLHETAVQQIPQLDAELSRGIGPQELEIFFKVIDQMKKNLEDRSCSLLTAVKEETSRV
ncbi:MAG: MarR family transcriptional regulator [Pygmaiobacter massiliensis]|nr:MarR family transcriptional regulator [Pygmaiobacter massiliensis]